ncbi:MAG TPA: AI-2E family transporter [Acetobacteraceae bacterium]|nr:AI-2E family transporter [Acetobacteraceae bacterium]
MSEVAGRATGSGGKPPPIVREHRIGTAARRAEPRDPVRTIAHILRGTVIIVGAGVLVWVLSSAVVTLILAVILAVLLRGIGNWVSRHTGIGPTVAVLLVFLGLVLLICGLGYWTGPRFMQEGRQLWSEVSGRLGGLENLVGFGRSGGGPGGGSGGAAQMMSGHESEFAAMLRTLASSFIGLLAAVLVIVATGVYLAISPETYVAGLTHLVPLWYQGRAREILYEMGEAMQGWMLGQLIDMVIVGVIVWVGLTLTGTPLAHVLGIVAGALTFVPYFGTIISAVPAVIVGAAVSIQQVIWVIVVFVVAHSVEGYVVAPFVQRRTVHLPPALTLISFVVMVAFFSIFGVLVATPLMAVIMVGVTRIYVEDVLGDPAGKHLKVCARWYWFTPPAD